MEKVKDFLTKYKTYVVTLFLVIFVFKSCGKGNEIKRLNKTIDANALVVDSLNKVIIEKGLETEESIARHFSFLDSCNNYFSSKDRTNEEMFFQKNYIIPELNKRNK
jgi:hypothetical protein